MIRSEGLVLLFEIIKIGCFERLRSRGIFQDQVFSHTLKNQGPSFYFFAQAPFKINTLKAHNQDPIQKSSRRQPF